MSEEKINHEERFATSTSYHGMAHIYDDHTSKSTRSFWLILTLLATGGCISQCVIIIYNASLLPTRIVTKTILQNTSVFPSVTICNTNDYDRSSLGADDLAHLSAIVDYIYGYAIPPDQLEVAVDYLSIKFGENFDYELFLRSAGHKLQNMLVSCTWMGRPCSSKDFINTSTAAGSCFTFNPGSIDTQLKNQTASGNAYGLRLILNVEQYKYYSGLYTPGQPDAGIRYALHYYKDPPNMVAESYYAAPGFHTYVPMTLKYEKRLKKPWGDCGEHVLKQYPFYSRYACLTELSASLASISCNCSYQEYNASNPCNGLQFLTCITPSAAAIRTYLSRNLSICPIACETYSYATEISQSSIASQAFSSVMDTFVNITGLIANAKSKNWIPRNQTYTPIDFIRDNIVYLDIYYRKLDVTQTLQLEDTGFSKVLSDIGGQMGLFIGASALTVCEIAQYLIQKYFTSKWRSEAKNTSNVVTSDNRSIVLERTTAFMPRDA